MKGEPIPTAPPGFATCNVHDGTQDLFAVGATRQVNHLVVQARIGTPGNTLCGLTRFGPDADLPGWSIRGGVSGPDVDQVRCEKCWAVAS